MKPVLLVKPAPEISLKTDFVRSDFEKRLKDNIKKALKKNGVEAEIVKGFGRMFVYSEDLNKCRKILSKIFGLHSIAQAFEFEVSDLNGIAGKTASLAEKVLKKGDSFAVRASRAGKHDFSSHDVNVAAGDAILTQVNGVKVDLKNPDREIFVEVRDKKFYVYNEELKCPGGLPVGVEGNVALFFSGKKEELAAAWLLMKRGCSVYPVVEKYSPELEKALRSLVKWNHFNEFFLAEKKDLQALIDSRKIQAFVSAETGFRDFSAEDSGLKLPVFRPLLFMEEKELSDLIGLIENE